MHYPALALGSDVVVSAAINNGDGDQLVLSAHNLVLSSELGGVRPAFKKANYINLSSISSISIATDGAGNFFVAGGKYLNSGQDST